MGTIGFRPTGESSHRVNAAGELMVGGIPLEYYDRMLAARGHFRYPRRSEQRLAQGLGDQQGRHRRDGHRSRGGHLVHDPTRGRDRRRRRRGGRPGQQGGGLVRVDTRVIIDASGDGIAAVQAGAKYEVGRASDQKSEAATLYFEMAGIDLARLLDHLEDHPEDISHHHRKRGITAATLRRDWEAGGPFVVRLGVNYRPAREAGLLPSPVGAEHSAQPDPSLGTFWMHWRDGQWVASTFSVNMDTTYGLDPRDRDAYDDALVATRRFVLDIVRYYQANAPGFGEVLPAEVRNPAGGPGRSAHPRPIPVDRAGRQGGDRLPRRRGSVRRPDRYPPRGPRRQGVPSLGCRRGPRLVPDTVSGPGGRRCGRSADGRPQHLGRPCGARVGAPPGHLYDDRPGSGYRSRYRRPRRGAAARCRHSATSIHVAASGSDHMNSCRSRGRSPDAR